MILVIVPCSKTKIWRSGRPSCPGQVPAEDAYVSRLFRTHRDYARAVGDAWLILSAYYGFLEPRQLIGDYEQKLPVLAEAPGLFIRQGLALGFQRYAEIHALGGVAYRAMVRNVLRALGIEDRCREPFAGLNILQLPRAVREATRALLIHHQPEDLNRN